MASRAAPGCLGRPDRPATGRPEVVAQVVTFSLPRPFLSRRICCLLPRGRPRRIERGQGRLSQRGQH